jgi:hypothetical protein
MEAYFDVREPGSYGGIKSLYRLMKQKKQNVTHKQVVNWLAEQEAYNLHKPIRRRFLRRKIFARGIDYLWQADLVDMTHLADHNEGYRFLLTVIDVFSKYAWTVPLKRKDAKSVAEAFDEIFTERKPQKLQTDKGKEFVNSTFQKKLEEIDVQFYVSQNDDIKASVAERFNRTLKTKMWKYFTHRNTFKYTDVLQDLIYSYNHSYHRTIGCTPASVKTDDVPAIRERMYGTSEKSSVPKLKIGTKVRISKSRRPFDKGYLPNWTEEIFTIVDAIQTSPPTYKLEDYGGEKLDGSFYEQELQRVVKTDRVYKIDKIVRTRRKAGAKEYFVKWKGYPDKFNSWVKDSEMTNVI